jgi:hypothetical protein
MLNETSAHEQVGLPRGELEEGGEEEEGLYSTLSCPEGNDVPTTTQSYSNRKDGWSRRYSRAAPRHRRTEVGRF